MSGGVGPDGGAPEVSEELLAVIAAAALVALRRGLRRPIVTGVAPASAGPGPSPWLWSGRFDLMAGRRGAQRRGGWGRR